MTSRSDPWREQQREDQRYGLDHAGPVEDQYLEGCPWLTRWRPSPTPDLDDAANAKQPRRPNECGDR